MSCDPNYVFSIDGHSLQVIEADGVNQKPVVVDSLQIFAGQRYSFIVSNSQVTSLAIPLRAEVVAQCARAFQYHTRKLLDQGKTKSSPSEQYVRGWHQYGHSPL